jgi:ABC-type antimicrobial peptide transport system permease subunit
MALGARAADIVRHVTVGAFVLVSVGLLLGLGGGVAFGRVVSAVLFRVTPTDAGALATPLLVLAVVFVLASLPPVIRAVRTNPTETLRSD